MAEMAMVPIRATNALLMCPWYFAMAGTRLMAYIGMMNRMVAMMGPPRDSIMPRMEGLAMAVPHRVRTKKAMMNISTFLWFGSLPDLRMFWTIIPFRPSRAPR